MADPVSYVPRPPARAPGALPRLGWALSFAVLWLGACDEPTPTEPPRVPDLSVEAILDHVAVLADDSMRGRAAGTPQELSAAGYIRERFASHSLDPGTPGYFQYFGVPPGANRPEGLTSQNVVGVLPGVGSLASEWIVLGAHYDHLGVRDPEDGDSIYNGADDNASGTAMLLELSRVLTEYVALGGVGQSRRSVIFQGFGAEEVGLVGSRHYCGEPTVPLEAIVAMLNFDMVGSLRDNLILIGTSSSVDWELMIQGANQGALPLLFSEEALRRSDQFCFYQNGIPVVFFHTGLHDQYHTPDDEVEIINEQGMIEIGSFAMELLLDLLTRPSPPA